MVMKFRKSYMYIMFVENFPCSLHLLSIYATKLLNVFLFLFIIYVNRLFFSKRFNFVFYVVISLSGGHQHMPLVVLGSRIQR